MVLVGRASRRRGIQSWVVILEPERAWRGTESRFQEVFPAGREAMLLEEGLPVVADPEVVDPEVVDPEAGGLATTATDRGGTAASVGRERPFVTGGAGACFRCRSRSTHRFTG